jgi:hypothetical protein
MTIGPARCVHNYSIDNTGSDSVRCPYCEESVAKIVSELSAKQSLVVLFGSMILLGILPCLLRPEKS